MSARGSARTTASEADVGAAMKAAISNGDKADPEPRMLPESQCACPLDEFGDIAVLSGEQSEPGHGIRTVAIRWFIVQDLAAGFDCMKPLQAWNK